MLAEMKLEENELFKEHTAAYDVFVEVPEINSHYEDKYERFLMSYKKKYNTTEESEHMNKMWQKYWKLCIENIKAKDWKNKRKELLEKYKLKAREPRIMDTESISSKSNTPTTRVSEEPSRTSMSSAKVLMAISEISSQKLDDFTVSGALDLLGKVSDNIGEAGVASKSLVESVRIFGIDTQKAMNLIAAEQNILALNCTFEKLLSISQDLSGTEAEYYKKCIAWGLHLIKYAKDFKEEEKSSEDKSEKPAVRFDVNLFAQQTYNQEPSWIFETLEQSLEYVYDAKPSKDIVKQMFANISTIHLNMSASTPYLLSGSVASSDFLNPGIVSHAEQNVNVTSFSNIPLTPLIPNLMTNYQSYHSSVSQIPTSLISTIDTTATTSSSTASQRGSRSTEITDGGSTTNSNLPQHSSHPYPSSSQMHSSLTNELVRNAHMTPTPTASSFSLKKPLNYCSFSNPPPPPLPQNPPPPPPPPTTPPSPVPPPPPPDDSPPNRNTVSPVISTDATQPLGQVLTSLVPNYLPPPFQSFQSPPPNHDMGSSQGNFAQPQSNVIDTILNLAKQNSMRK